MSIAEKLVTVAENVSKVFNAGQLSVISQSEALKGFANGEVISIKDISPVEHNVKCSVSSDTVQDLSSVKIKRLGKNLFDPSKFLAGSGWKKTNDGVYYGNSALLYAVYKKSTNNPIVSGVFKESTRYTISFLHRTDTNTGGITFQWEYTDGTVGDAFTSQNKSDIFELRSTTSKAGKTVKAVYLSYGNTSGSYFKDVQLEEGATTDRNRVTEFEPYNCTEYTANADGIVEGIKSLYPSMTLTSDTEGVIFTAEYIKDIDKAFDERLAEIEKALVNN